jgi:hypothetical protein
MFDERDEVAALNNAEWCAAVWRSHGLTVEQACGLWFCPHRTPPYYPNVVTVERAANTAEQTAFIAELGRVRPDLKLGVKDSFACLNLRMAGLTPLFDARWLWRDEDAAVAAVDGLQWRRVEDERGLADWERAWRAGANSDQRIFLPELLSDRRAVFLGGFDTAGIVLAGGIVYAAADALGLTNVFGSRVQLMSALASLLPRQLVVGYESGDDLRAAEMSGFEVLGPLRVWTSDP